jgi:hypothetical protein
MEAQLAHRFGTKPMAINLCLLRSPVVSTLGSREGPWRSAVRKPGPNENSVPQGLIRQLVGRLREIICHAYGSPSRKVGFRISCSHHRVR